MAVEYIRWDDPRVEYKDKDEDADIQAVVDLINNSQRKVFSSHGHAFGATHIKTHGLVKGELVVNSNLPDYLAQGLFKVAGEKHPIAMRYSTETTERVDDRIPQPRGLGLKIFNVDGKKLRDSEEDTRTHDIEFNSAPAIELRDAKTCAQIFGLRTKHGDDQAALDADLRKRDDYELQDARNHIPNKHVAVLRQYSQSALRHGDFIAKYSLVPSSETLKSFNTSKVQQEHSAHVLREWLSDYYKEHDAVYELQAQVLTESLFSELDGKAVEDAGIEWPQDKYPYETVATITIPIQDSYSPARRVMWEDHIRLDPWHGLEAHRPLGSINRLRKPVYAASSALRRKLNATTQQFVSDISQIPD